jgi:hypothetical protein
VNAQEVAAAGVGGVILAAALLSAWGWRLRPYGAGLALALTLAGAAALDLLPIDGPRARLWIEVIARRETLGVMVLAWLGVLGAPRIPPSGRVGTVGLAALAALVVGALPGAAALMPRTRSPGEGAQVALVASAAGALSPFGGAGSLLLGEARPDWLAFVAAPAIAAVGVAFVIPRAMGLGHRASTGSSPPPMTRWQRLRPVRFAVASIGLVALSQLAGAAWYLGRGIAWLARQDHAAALLVLAAWTASVGDRTLVGMVTDRATELVTTLPPHTEAALALGVGLAPGVPLLLAVSFHGVAALRSGAPAALAQLALAMGWAWLFG